VGQAIYFMAMAGGNDENHGIWGKKMVFRKA
jgi:hypothetical protein